MQQIFFSIDGAAYNGFEKEIWDTVANYLLSRGDKKLRSAIFETLDEIFRQITCKYTSSRKQALDKERRQAMRFRLEQKLERLTKPNHPKHKKEWLRFLASFQEQHEYWWRSGLETLEHYLASNFLKQYDKIKKISPFADDDLCFPRGFAAELRKECFEDYQRFLHGAQKSGIEIRTDCVYAVIRSKDRKNVEVIKLC